MHSSNPSQTLILASTSRYRAELLGRLGIPFQTAAPRVNEAHRDKEPPETRAARLAREKSVALAAQFPEAVLLGSDQVASLKETPTTLFDKPGTEANAIETLLNLRGKSVHFHTALCLHHPSSARFIEHTDLTSVEVRADLTEEAIARYVHADDPLQCAGAFKVESLGIALFTAVRSEDPSALIGLPLIATASGLRDLGFAVP